MATCCYCRRDFHNEASLRRHLDSACSVLTRLERFARMKRASDAATESRKRNGIPDWCPETQESAA